MRETVRIVRQGQVKEIGGFAPTETLLDHLRLRERAVGTKEGCAEGDCGACTVALGRLKDGKRIFEPVNACILLTGMADGAEVVTVEDIGSLLDPHPVQEAMVRHHGSQCGFCTPGIVMALFCMFHAKSEPATREAVNEWLAGNLCRCTGYRPIVAAAIDALSRAREDSHSRAEPDIERLLHDFEVGDSFLIGDNDRFFAAPASVAELAELYEKHPEATLVAGATDVGLWITKAMKDLPKIIWLGQVLELNKVEETSAAFLIGATCTYSDVEAAMNAIDPDLGELWCRIGSKQVRSSGTVGGNIANGSPIGDTPPALIALGAVIELQKGREARTLRLEDFFLEYGRQDIREGEFLTGILVPKLKAGQIFRCHKISKRFDQDISSVMGAFSFVIDGDRICDPVIAYGGMAGTPRRALSAEAELEGARIGDTERWHYAMRALDRDFTPLSDHRAGERYRREAAKALLGKTLAEISGVPTLRTRIRGARPLETADE